jgi:hypothetical protein
MEVILNVGIDKCGMTNDFVGFQIVGLESLCEQDDNPPKFVLVPLRGSQDLKHKESVFQNGNSISINCAAFTNLLHIAFVVIPYNVAESFQTAPPHSNEKAKAEKNGIYLFLN